MYLRLHLRVHMKVAFDDALEVAKITWLESYKLYIFANFIYHTFGWWLLLLYTIFLVASTSLAKCYSRPWLYSWLFSEETLWVACEKLFLEVLDNDNNNNKDLYASSIFKMALRAIEKKLWKWTRILKYINILL